MKTVFTNGVFDLLHSGHLQFLEAARAKGDRLIVAINSDESARRLKPGRPFVSASDRGALLAALRCVDEVWYFDEDSAVGALWHAFMIHWSDMVYARGEGDLPAESSEAKFCRANRIEVEIIPKLVGYSTTATVDRIRASVIPDGAGELASMIVETHRRGGTVYLCGNGGSAAEASHFAAELVGRFKREREPLRAVNIAADMATLTAIANDYGYENVFARPLLAASDKDLLIALSTSGASVNVLRALRVFGGARWLLAGTRPTSELDGVRIVRAAGGNTAAIQEGHLAFIHAVCAQIDTLLSPSFGR